MEWTILIKDIKNNKIKDIINEEMTIRKRAQVINYIKENGEQNKEHKNQYTIDGCIYEIKAWDPNNSPEIVQIGNKEYVQYTGFNGKEWLEYIDEYEYLQTDSFGTPIYDLNDFINWQFDD
jgi:hypothetical protein